MKYYNVHEVLKILEQYYITDSIQMVTRWIRERKILAERSDNKKDGWKIYENDLFEFIEDKRPGLPQVMSVYEGYIKNLHVKQDESSRLTTVNNVEKEPNEEVIPTLREEVLTLESMVEQLQDSLSQVNEDMIKVLDQNYKLIEENKLLQELYEMMDQEIKALKSNHQIIPKKIEGVKEKKTVHEQPRKTRNMSFEQFKNIADEVIAESKQKFEPKEIQKKVQALYSKICSEDGKFKEELVDQEGVINCPFTKGVFKQPKRFVKNAVKYVLEDQGKAKEKTIAS
jgi:small-conductance mechanosensitive channel